MLGARRLTFATFASFGLLIWAFSATALADPVIVTFSTLGSWNDGPYQKNNSISFGRGQDSISFTFRGVKDLSVSTEGTTPEETNLGTLEVKYKGDPEAVFSDGVTFSLQILESSPVEGKSAAFTADLSLFSLNFHSLGPVWIPDPTSGQVINFKYELLKNQYNVDSFTSKGKNWTGSVLLTARVADPPAPQSPIATPEPGTLLLLGSGLSALALYGFRKIKK